LNKFFDHYYSNYSLLWQIVHSQSDDYWYNWAGLRVKKTEDSGGTWKTTYTLFDGVNPLMQEVYDSSGTAIDRYRYSAWGEATQDTGSDDYRSFTGKDYDATGLIYFNARYYDPATARFLTEDPAMKGISWYGYCENNPLVYVDLRGMQSYWSEYVTTLEDKSRVYQKGTNQIKTFKNIDIQRIRNDIIRRYEYVRIQNSGDNPVEYNDTSDLGRTVVINMPDSTWVHLEEYLISEGYAQPQDYIELAKEIRIEFFKSLVGMSNKIKNVVLVGAHGNEWQANIGGIKAKELIEKENIDLPNDVHIYLGTCLQGKLDFKDLWAKAFGVPVENVHGIEGLSSAFTTKAALVEHKYLGVPMDKAFSAAAFWDAALEWFGLLREP
jgi:RHS repeat-associated protein